MRYDKQGLSERPGSFDGQMPRFAPEAPGSDLDLVNKRIRAMGLPFSVEGLSSGQAAVYMSKIASTRSGLVFTRSGFKDLVAFKTTAEQPLFKLMLPVGGDIVMDVSGGGTLTIQAGQALFIDLHQTISWRFRGATRSLCMFVDGRLLTERLAERVNGPVVRRLAFKPVLDQTRPEIAALIDLVKSLETTGVLVALRAAPISAKRLAMLISDMVLEVLDHNYREALQGGNVAVPRHVKRAMAYIDANAGRQISSAELAAAAGVSVRSLQYGFRNFLDTTVLDYARSVRLASARREIGRTPKAPLGEIARRWGFTNLTRFHTQFEAAFGESVAAFKADGQDRGEDGAAAFKIDERDGSAEPAPR